MKSSSATQLKQSITGFKRRLNDVSSEARIVTQHESQMQLPSDAESALLLPDL